MSQPRELHLNANVLASGRHDAAWRLAANANPVADIDAFIDIARIAERGKLDAVFLADGPQLSEEYVRRPWHALDPFVLLSSMAMVTTYIGLVCTASTTFNHPYHVARRFASLDHVSKGRAAWNMVTSHSEAAAANFGPGPLPDHASRYQRAHEFAEVVTKLWDSFDDDAVVADQHTGQYVDARRVHRIDHHGKIFSVAGPLNVPRSPQGRPVIVQAGDSAASRELGAQWADALFTVQRTLAEAKEFYAQMKGLAKRNGRDPEQLVIMPGLYTVVGSTEQEAQRRKDEMDNLLDLEAAVAELALRFNVEPGRLRLDQPLPDDIGGVGGLRRQSSGFTENLLREARQQHLTVRQLLGRNPFGGHRLIVGTPKHIADDIEYWFHNRAADGFNLTIDSYPDGLALFVDHVVPELQRRRLFRKDYAGTTLRDHLGLQRPASQFHA
jgi:FMN-dependent oxidoreductase (nitrilotriacetate monooxygenase family)